MQTRIQAVQFKAKQDLYTKIEAYLEQNFGDYPFITNTDVFLKEINDNGVDKKEIDIRMHVNGTQFFASNREDNFDTALRGVTDKLKRQLGKYKQKLYRSRL